MEKLEITSRLSKRKKRFNFDLVIAIPYLAILILFVIIPVLLLVVYSFSARVDGVGFEISFTFNHYITFFTNSIIWKTMGKSIFYAFLATVMTLIIGYPLAYIISRQKERTQAILILVINIPMWINMLLRVKGLQQVMQIIDPLFHETSFAMIIGLVQTFLPFMVLPIYTVLSKLDASLFESAADLGASRLKTITRVVMPLSISGVFSGVIMVFLPAATTLVIPKYLGDGSHTIGNVIESAIIKQQYGGFGYGASISVMMSLIMMALVFLVKRSSKYNEDY